jgi:hypothetical protein
MVASRRSVPVLGILLGLAVASLVSREALATTIYHVRLNTSPWRGLNARLTFDLTGGDPNTVSIMNFRHDGRLGAPLTQGGLIDGDVILGMNPAYFTQMSHFGADGETYFFTSLGVSFDSLGTTVQFSVDLSEYTIFPDRPIDELSFYVLGQSDQHPFDTADPTGANALFSVAIDGAPGGVLSVYSPMTFVAPDSLILGLPVLGVPHVPAALGRLRFRSVYPNPSSAGVRFDFELPGSGGNARLVIYDLSGRVVERVLDARRPGGLGSVEWSGRTASGRRAGPGIYLAQLVVGGQSVVRKIALTP